MEGYRWINKNRQTRGGGVALLIREDINHLIKTVDNLEDHDQEILWTELTHGKEKVFIGIFYGPQEKCSNEEADRQYSQLTTQINTLRQQGEIILMGDFNAKLEISNEYVTQTESRNGKCLRNMLEDTQTEAVSTKATKGNWTRVKR